MLLVTNLHFIGVFAIIYWCFVRIYVMIFRKPIYGFSRYKNYCWPIKTKYVQALMIDLGLTDKPTFRVCFMIDRYSFYFSLSGNSYLLRILFTNVNISFHKKKSTVWLRFGRNICIRDNKKRDNSLQNYPFSWFYFLQSILVLLWNWIDRNVLFICFQHR